MSDSITESPDAVVDAHFDAEVKLDIPAVVAGFAAEFEHEAVGDPLGLVTTPDGLRERYEHIFGPLTDPQIRNIRRLHGDGFVVDESEVVATVDGMFLGFQGAGQRVNFRVLHVFEIRDGKIVSEQGWPDVRAIAQQLG